MAVFHATSSLGFKRIDFNLVFILQITGFGDRHKFLSPTQAGSEWVKAYAWHGSTGNHHYSAQV